MSKTDHIPDTTKKVRHWWRCHGGVRGCKQDCVIGLIGNDAPQFCTEYMEECTGWVSVTDVPTILLSIDEPSAIIERRSQ